MTSQLADDIYGTAFKGGAALFLCRVLRPNGAPLQRADLRSIAYSVFLLDDQDPDARAAVSGHAAVGLTVADVVFDALQTVFPWDAAADPDGYNFRHALDVSRHAAFPIAGRHYLVEYRLTPVAGQVVIVRFRIYAI